jgi:uncharacterized protein
LRDLQVTEAEVRRLAKADAKARLVPVPDVNHVLETVASDDLRANMAACADPALPLAPGLVDAIAGWVASPGGVARRRRRQASLSAWPAWSWRTRSR